MDAEDLDDIRRLTEIAVLCNNTQLPQEEEGKSLFRASKAASVQGDPTESALLVMAEAAHFSIAKMIREFSRTFEIPFDSQRKRMSVVVRNGQEGTAGSFPKARQITCWNFVATIWKMGR